MNMCLVSSVSVMSHIYRIKGSIKLYPGPPKLKTSFQMQFAYYESTKDCPTKPLNLMLCLLVCFLHEAYDKFLCVLSRIKRQIFFIFHSSRVSTKCDTYIHGFTPRRQVQGPRHVEICAGVARIAP